MLILDDILFSPWNGFRFVLEQIQKKVNQELMDEDVIQEKLLELEFEYELGEINEEQYEKQRTALLNRLREIKEYKQETALQEDHKGDSSEHATNIQELGEDISDE